MYFAVIVGRTFPSGVSNVQDVSVCSYILFWFTLFALSSRICLMLNRVNQSLVSVSVGFGIVHFPCGFVSYTFLKLIFFVFSRLASNRGVFLWECLTLTVRECFVSLMYANAWRCSVNFVLFCSKPWRLPLGVSDAKGFAIVSLWYIIMFDVLPLISSGASHNFLSFSVLSYCG